ncbi:hypothetical protein C4D60_Mb10t02220 [Musa balbisiana]|uniref:R13L1/DRL21-like LRR repeat region domain-containing protein n=1 Tax=Musa balbisiana TaxID=52838 RepID=A0A4S8IU72_MUSBA|nr:hypothetical protein C4D60_Mb10t02220 [Musa balbisiana]
MSTCEANVSAILINLRHLEATTKLITKITGLGNLTCLQDLKKFTVRKAKGHKIKELKEMNELRGNLRIKKLENVFSGKQASEANLYAKEFLHTLSLEWSDERSVNCEGENLHEEVLEALQPHHDLKELTITGYAGLQNSDSLHWSRLSALHINECVNLASLQQGLLEQQLRALEQLTITGCQELAKLPTEVRPYQAPSHVDRGEQQSSIVLHAFVCGIDENGGNKQRKIRKKKELFARLSLNPSYSLKLVKLVRLIRQEKASPSPIWNGPNSG